MNSLKPLSILFPLPRRTNSVSHRFTLNPSALSLSPLMKLSLSSFLNSPRKPAYLKALRLFFSSNSNLTSSSRTGSDSLYRRISPVGDPNASVVPVLDQWVKEGRAVERNELQSIIQELKAFRRYKHALEVSQWMTDKRYIPLTPSDISVRLNLIYRVHGIKQVENYFNNIPQKVKGFNTYFALLNCYANDKLVEKAEAIMQKLRDMGYARTVGYNIMMNLYYQLGNQEKLDLLIQEMEKKGIEFDNYSFGIQLSAYATASDSEGIDKIVTRMESDPRITLDSYSYAVAAHSYLKVGQIDKALGMLNKLEGHLATTKRRSIIFDDLLRLYAETGKKDEVHRIWNLYKKEEQIFNKGYMSMMRSLMMFNDIESAEKIFEEWESRGLTYDFRVLNFLIDAYCKNGLLGKAEALLERGISKGGIPSVTTWHYLAGAYIEDNQIPKAVEALKKAIFECPPYWKPSKDTFSTCLECLEGRGDMEKVEEFIRLLKEEGCFSDIVHDKLRRIIKHGQLPS